MPSTAPGSSPVSHVSVQNKVAYQAAAFLKLLPATVLVKAAGTAEQAKQLDKLKTTVAKLADL